VPSARDRGHSDYQGSVPIAEVVLLREAAVATVAESWTAPIAARVPHRAGPAAWRHSPWARCLLAAGVTAIVVVTTGPKLRSAATGLVTLPVPSIWWLSGVVLGACGFYICCALSVRAASGQPLRLARTVAAQLASAAANRLLPGGVGATTVNIRYLRQAGMPLPAATAAIAIVGVTVSALHLAGAAAVAISGGLLLRPPPLPMPAVVVVAAVSTALLACLAWRPQLRARTASLLDEARLHLTVLLHDPRRAVVLLASGLGSKASHLLGLAAALQAFGVHLPLLTVTCAYLTATLVAAGIPAPAGVGPLEATMLTALVHGGATAAPALAAIIAFRLLGYWLPVIPGVLLLRRGRRVGWI